MSGLDNRLGKHKSPYSGRRLPDEPTNAHVQRPAIRPEAERIEPCLPRIFPLNEYGRLGGRSAKPRGRFGLRLFRVSRRCVADLIDGQRNWHATFLHKRRISAPRDTAFGRTHSRCVGPDQSCEREYRRLGSLHMVS
jgi:hypothetical protein